MIMVANAYRRFCTRAKRDKRQTVSSLSETQSRNTDDELVKPSGQYVHFSDVMTILVTVKRNR